MRKLCRKLLATPRPHHFCRAKPPFSLHIRQTVTVSLSFFRVPPLSLRTRVCLCLEEPDPRRTRRCGRNQWIRFFGALAADCGAAQYAASARPEGYQCLQ